MGVVYHAIDPNIGRPVAIKTIYLGKRKPEEISRLRERLFREARSAGILSHPGIVTIYDVEQQGDLAYIAMEYVDGPTLDQLLSRAQPVEPAQMFSVLGQTAAALDYAHQKGIIHRDIKPANIMVTGDGTAKITDFGIAKVAASEQLTTTGSIVGTPHYMSPEQVQGQAVDGRSDQFSLAVIAFEMLTGDKPYTGEHLTTVVYKIVAEEPAPPNRLNPSLSGGIDAVIRKGLTKKADGRYKTCQEFVDALERACAATKGWKPMARGGMLSEPTLAEVVAHPVVTLPPARRRVVSTASGEHGPRRKTGFLAFLLAILVAAGLLALIGWQAAPYWFANNAAKSGEAQPPAPTAPPKQEAQTPVEKKPVLIPVPPPVEQAEAKPSPMPPPPEKTAPAETPARKPQPPVERPPVPVPAMAQPVTIISSPGGATATLDGRSATACTTPCWIDAAPGRHTVAISMDGYHVESREVEVGSNPIELGLVMLRPLGGAIMLTSEPSGAAVLVNDKRIDKTTPAQIQLAPGTYKITVEKDGKQSSETVEVRSGLRYLKIALGQ